MEALKKPTATRRFKHVPFGSKRPEYGAANFARRLRRRILLTLRIPPRITITAWAQQHITLPKDSSRKNDKFVANPFQVDILNAMGDTTLNEVVCMKSVRVGWTQLVTLALAYGVAYLAAPVALVTINDAKVKEYVKLFWEPLFRRKNNPNKVLKAIRRTFVKRSKQDQLGDWCFLNGGSARFRAAGSDDNFRGCCRSLGACFIPIWQSGFQFWPGRTYRIRGRISPDGAFDRSLFRIKYPDDWNDAECYDFDWSVLKTQTNRFEKFDYDTIPYKWPNSEA